MSLIRGFFPALQSLQNQLPWGISIFKHSLWKAAGQDSQQSRLPPETKTSQQTHNTHIRATAFCEFPHCETNKGLILNIRRYCNIIMWWVLVVDLQTATTIVKKKPITTVYCKGNVNSAHLQSRRSTSSHWCAHGSCSPCEEWSGSDTGNCCWPAPGCPLPYSCH